MAPSSARPTKARARLGGLALATALLAACGSQGGQSGWTETPLGRIAANASVLSRPAAAVDADGHLAVAYVDGGAALQVAKWNGASWAAVGSVVNAPGTSATAPALALDSGALIVAWEDATAGASAVRAARFDGTSWVPLGDQVALAFSARGAWGVAKYEASGWDVVATVEAPVSALATGPDSRLYLLYTSGTPDASLSAPLSASSFHP